MPSARFLSAVPLFAGLEPRDLEVLVGFLRPAAFAPGECLVRQGQAADSAYLLVTGTADVITALPGGGAATVATLGPGSVLGEMALLDSATRLATVVARSAVTSYALERDGFRVLLAQRNDAAFQIQRRIARTLCARLRDLNLRVLARDSPGQSAAPLARRVPGRARHGASSFDYGAFLPVLPLFRRFTGPELGEFTRAGRPLEPVRGEIVFEQGTQGGNWYIVVRGAVEIDNLHGGVLRRIGVLGPGRLCGLLALIESAPHSMSAVARENSALLEFDRDAFERLYAGNDRLATGFQAAVNQELLLALARTNNHLTRLVSQARIRGARGGAPELDALERALGTQDVRPAEG